MNKIKKQIIETLENLGWLLDTHNSSAELVQIKGKKAVIQLTGQCADCDTNCIEDALHEKMPDIEFTFR